MMKYVMLLAIMGVSLVQLQGQEVVTESHTEEMDSSKFSKLRSNLDRLTMAHREELTLFKVDLITSGGYIISNNDSSATGLFAVGVEHKLQPEWSIFGAIRGGLDEDAKLSEWRYRTGARYYYNMNKRIRQGKSANNFSANYVSGRFSYFSNSFLDDDKLTFDVLIGAQSRLGRYFYFDFDLGVEWALDPYDGQKRKANIVSSIQLGLAF